MRKIHGRGKHAQNEHKDMKILRLFIFLLLASLVATTAPVRAKETPNHSPSLLDIPEKGLYYGFIMNNSSNFIEVSIWSVKKKKKVYRNIVLPPANSQNESNNQALEYWNKHMGTFRPPHVFSLWLQLGTYEVSIRQRSDIIEEGLAGTWKTFIVVLDKEYVENAKGPFTFEIEDD
jgi:hypothetical protein